jgi:hypothetical protein
VVQQGLRGVNVCYLHVFTGCASHSMHAAWKGEMCGLGGACRDGHIWEASIKLGGRQLGDIRLL